mgnify:CR=1 FL=1
MSVLCSMIRFTALLSLLILLVACKKDLPKSVIPGKYVWVHSYSDEYESESFQTVDITHSVKIKGNGTYKFYQDDEMVAKGNFGENDFFEDLPGMYGYSGDHAFWITEEGINIWGYPIGNHMNTFLKL